MLITAYHVYANVLFLWDSDLNYMNSAWLQPVSTFKLEKLQGRSQWIKESRATKSHKAEWGQTN